MRILHLGKFAPPAVGGMETFLAALMGWQNRHGHDACAVRLAAPDHARAPWRVFFLDWGATGAPRPPLCGENAPLAGACPHEGQSPPRTLDVAALWAGGGVPFAPGYRAAVRALVRSARPDVAHAHLPNLSALFALPEKGVPLVVHWHADVPARALPPALRPARPLYRLLVERALCRAARIVCTSHAVLRASPALFPHRDKCLVVPLGIDPGPWRLPACDPPPEDEPVTVLSLGRFAAYKGFDVLARAAALTGGPRFVLAGDGPLRKDVRNLAASLGLGPRMTFPGFVDDARRDALFRGCHLFCLPSVNRAEAFGLVLLEAMAAGKPVVACAPPGSGVAEVVEHEVTGLLVAPDDPRALARALERLARNPRDRLRMGLAGRRRLERLFTLDRAGAAIDAVYRKITA